MSAYGEIQPPTSTDILLSTIWPTKNDGVHITVYHMRGSRVEPGLAKYMHNAFEQVVEEGRTYPQEGKLDLDAFTKYFLSEDVFIGVIGTATDNQPSSIRSGSEPWEKRIAGFYYVKPNYPGRSSHMCNAGFVVPDVHRGTGYGSALARSYLHYAPRLGYKASVFNLVYVNNVASVKLWEHLGFTKAGRIPLAGRMKTEDGKGEEYVDAWVFYKEFEGTE